MKFMFNTNDISGTRLEHYVKLNAKEQAPQIYKPRSGKTNAN